MTPVKLGLRSLFTGVLVLLLGLWAPSPVAADFKAGADAALREEFDTALREWLPLAKAGDERAQYNIGLMYEHFRKPSNGTNAPRNGGLCPPSTTWEPCMPRAKR